MSLIKKKRAFLIFKKLQKGNAEILSQKPYMERKDNVRFSFFKKIQNI